MKKSTVAIGVVAALGIIWAGGSWYTGKTAEAEYQKQIDIANNTWSGMSSSLQTDIKIENLKFSRGFFSSSISYDLKVKPHNDSGNGFSVPFEGTLYHGPLPLDRLAKFNFTPVVMSVTSQIPRNEQTKTWFERAGGKNPLESSTVVTYNERFKGNVIAAPGKFEYQGINFDWDDFIVEYDIDKNGNGLYTYDIKKITASYGEEGLKNLSSDLEDNPLKSVELGFENWKGEQDLQRTELPNISLGKMNGTFGNVKVSYVYTDESDIPPTAMSFNNWKYDYLAEQKGEFLNYQMNNTAENMSVQNSNLGKFDLSMQMNHLPVKTMNSLVEAKDNEAVKQAGLELLQHQPHFVIKPLALTNESGKISTDLNVNLASADFSLAMQGKGLSLFKELSFNFNADKAALMSLFATAEQIIGTPKEDAEKLAKETVEQLISEGVQQQMIVDNDKSVSASLVLENNELKFNGNVIPEEHIGMFLLGLMMSQ